MIASVSTFKEKRDLQDVMEEMQDVLDTPSDLLPRMKAQLDAWHPTTDVYDLPREIAVEVELPEVVVSDFKLTVQQHYLLLEGSRTRPNDRRVEDLFYSERLFGKFHRVIHLPATIDTDTVRYDYKNGLLVIHLQKKEHTTD